MGDVQSFQLCTPVLTVQVPFLMFYRVEAITAEASISHKLRHTEGTQKMLSEEAYHLF